MNDYRVCLGMGTRGVYVPPEKKYKGETNAFPRTNFGSH